MRACVVHAPKNNQRVVKQDGAFILCGLSVDNNSILGHYFWFKEQGENVIALISNKMQIIKELDFFSINKATLFPELDCVAEYLTDKYSK